MTHDGKLRDVYIEDRIATDPSTGMLVDLGCTVWADPGMLDVIRGVPGVHFAYSDNGSGCEYTVYLDPRYDREWVKAEIEAQIKIQGGEA